jgi:predicted ATPase with chaperone activity
MRERVLAARAIHMARESINENTPPRRLREICPLDVAAEKPLEMAVRCLALSARARPHPEWAKHIGEVVQYRSLDWECCK